MAISLESTLDEFSELLGESRIIQVVYSETRPGSFGRVSWPDTFLGSSDGRSAEFNLLKSIDDLMETKDEVGSVRDE